MKSPDQVKDSLRCSWLLMHKTAAWIDLSTEFTPVEKKKIFASAMKYQIGTLACGECIKHAKSYMESNPPESDVASVWTWRFHNVVNRRLKKPEITWNAYRGMYLEKGETVCTSGCGE